VNPLPERVHFQLPQHLEQIIQRKPFLDFDLPLNPSSTTAAAAIGKAVASKEAFVSALRLGRPESALALIHRRSGRGDEILHRSILQTRESDTEQQICV
jgi:hypothetical protein